jgi:hypothetical protein
VEAARYNLSYNPHHILYDTHSPTVQLQLADGSSWNPLKYCGSIWSIIFAIQSVDRLQLEPLASYNGMVAFIAMLGTRWRTL